MLHLGMGERYQELWMGASIRFMGKWIEEKEGKRKVPPLRRSPLSRSSAAVGMTELGCAVPLKRDAVLAQFRIYLTRSPCDISLPIDCAF